VSAVGCMREREIEAERRRGIGSHTGQHNAEAVVQTAF
jgi:hypothetical protein